MWFGPDANRGGTVVFYGLFWGPRVQGLMLLAFRGGSTRTIEIKNGDGSSLKPFRDG